MGRVRTHMAAKSSGWGPSGRWFKSSRPDLPKPPVLVPSPSRPVASLDFFSREDDDDPALRIDDHRLSELTGSRHRRAHGRDSPGAE